jgi:hypothetical protein
MGRSPACSFEAEISRPAMVGSAIAMVRVAIRVHLRASAVPISYFAASRMLLRG